MTPQQQQRQQKQQLPSRRRPRPTSPPWTSTTAVLLSLFLGGCRGESVSFRLQSQGALIQRRLDLAYCPNATAVLQAAVLLYCCCCTIMSRRCHVSCAYRMIPPGLGLRVDKTLRVPSAMEGVLFVVAVVHPTTVGTSDLRRRTSTAVLHKVKCYS